MTKAMAIFLASVGGALTMGVMRIDLVEKPTRPTIQSEIKESASQVRRLPAGAITSVPGSFAGKEFDEELDYQEFVKFFSELPHLSADSGNHFRSAGTLLEDFEEQWARKFTEPPSQNGVPAETIELIRLCRNHYVYACDYLRRDTSERLINFYNRFVNGPGFRLSGLSEDRWRMMRKLNAKLIEFECRDGIGLQCMNVLNDDGTVHTELLALAQTYCDDGNADYCLVVGEVLQERLSGARRPANAEEEDALAAHAFEMLERACWADEISGCYDLLAGPLADRPGPLSEVALNRFTDLCTNENDLAACVMTVDATSHGNRDLVADAVRGYCDQSAERGFEMREADLSACDRLKRSEVVNEALWRDLTQMWYQGTILSGLLLDRHTRGDL